MILVVLQHSALSETFAREVTHTARIENVVECNAQMTRNCFVRGEIFNALSIQKGKA
jgi:hypothetical protein